MPGSTCGECITYTTLKMPIKAKILRIWPTACTPSHYCVMRFDVIFEEPELDLIESMMSINGTTTKISSDLSTEKNKISII